MIHPDKIRTEARKNEDENFKFRSYLKVHTDEKKLDKQFLRLHRELFTDYDCSKCKNLDQPERLRVCWECWIPLPYVP